MQIAQLLHEDHLDALPRGDDGSLLHARVATYVLDQEIAYDYNGPIADVRQQLMIVPRPRHGDQWCVAHRLDVAADRAVPQRVHHRADGFGNAVVHVEAAHVNESIRFGLRAVVRRDRTTDPVHHPPTRRAHRSGSTGREPRRTAPGPS